MTKIQRLGRLAPWTDSMRPLRASESDLMNSAYENDEDAKNLRKRPQSQYTFTTRARAVATTEGGTGLPPRHLRASNVPFLEISQKAEPAGVPIGIVLCPTR
eukprot:CAMPEP_0198319138 /NCGR_PEP_ID=MMETSP1450-20131203/8347_1 /TAXON_ID=753684 ORGANISM="Madagascaria erythrocladiodes, Strain CCMP3234" /NCGR_SAMPLE_ID=MMETSP1450 /ASSEMBLY_ACC=CAM_ASM_001115 /LENGTH=101 /DNA_ID=CAMNT_0044022497 /DNA_START=20 /DNA_END=325 /DNA_ORIENTATION=+